METAYKAADDELSLKITANESKITTLNGDVNTSGSVAKAEMTHSINQLTAKLEKILSGDFNEYALTEFW